jgi:hypothetical protein
MLRVLSASVLALLIDASIGVAYAQSRNETSGPAAGGDDLIVSTAGLWGGSLGVYSCDQWRRYVTDLFDRAGGAAPLQRQPNGVLEREVLRGGKPLGEGLGFLRQINLCDILAQTAVNT